MGDSPAWEWLQDYLEQNKHKLCHHEVTKHTWVGLGGVRVTCTLCAAYRVMPNVSWQRDVRY